MLTLVDIHVRAAGSSTPLLQVARLDIAHGERVVVTGASGSGKTLLLSVIAGRVRPGLAVSGTRRATRVDRVGIVPQRGLDALHPLIRLDRQLAAVTGADRERVSAVFARVGLDDPHLARRRPAELSGGQAQRAAIALAVLTDAPLVVADEPTSALDPRTRDEVLAVVAGAFSASGSARTPALVLSTHDPVVAATLDARRIEIVAGRIVRDIAAGAEAA